MKGEGGKKLVQWRAAVCFLLGMQVTHTHTDTHTHTHTRVRAMGGMMPAM